MALTSPGIVKVWLQFPSDAEESYTSLPCGGDVSGQELADRVAVSVKKRRGLNITIVDDDTVLMLTTRSESDPPWRLVTRAWGTALKLGEKVWTQLDLSGERELKLELAPLPDKLAEPLPVYPVGQCIHAGAKWCPAQAFVSYLACSGLLSVELAEALSQRCQEEQVLGLAECVAALSSDLDGLRQNVTARQHARVVTTLHQIQTGTIPEALQERLKPVREKKASRVRTVTDTAQVIATIHTVPVTPSAPTRSVPAPAASSSSSNTPTRGSTVSPPVTLPPFGSAATSSSSSSSTAAAVHAAASAPAAAPPAASSSADLAAPPPVVKNPRSFPVVSSRGSMAYMGQRSMLSAAAASGTSSVPPNSVSPAPSSVSPIASSNIISPSPKHASAAGVSPSSVPAVLSASAESTSPSAAAAAAATDDASPETPSPSDSPPIADQAANLRSDSPPPPSGPPPVPPPDRGFPKPPEPIPSPTPGGSSTASSARKPPPLPASLSSPSAAAAGPARELVIEGGVLVERVTAWPTIAFDVTKVNERGRRQPRVLRLTATHLQNIRDKDTITSRHAYDDVLCVTLADHETLVISYLNAHDYTYVSPIALQICQDINERISKKREKQKQVLASNLQQMAIKFQEKNVSTTHYRREQQQMEREGKKGVLGAIAQLEAAAQASGSKDGDSPSKGGGGGVVPSSAPASSNSVLSPRSGSGGGAFAASSSSSAAPGDRPNPLVRVPSKSAQKLQQLFGSTQSQRLQLAIDTLLLDANSDAGRARARFLKNLSVLERKPDTMLPVIRQFMDSLRAFIETKRVPDLRRSMGLLPSSTGPLPGEEDMELGERIERAVQGAVVQPVYARILASLRKLCQGADEAISLGVSRLRTQVGPDQSHYGIPPAHCNLANWQAAVEELNDVDRAHLPADKLKGLLRCAKAIYNTFNDDLALRNKLAGKDQSKGQFFLSADDFFPIFVFCVANSSLQCLDSTRQFMWGLCERSSLNGEGGYYLTVFEAACEHIKNQPAILDAKVSAGRT